MPDPPGRSPQPAAWWGSILAAARKRATTAEVWQAIRSYADEAGLQLPPNLFAEVNRMRSLASGLRASSDQLMRARSSDALTSGMIGHQIYQRGGPGQALAPLYHVRFQMEHQLEGLRSTGWYTLEYSGQLPDTVGDLMDDIAGYAEGLSGTYGVELVGVGTVEIGEW
jgi:hypothetical protein